MAQFIFFNNVKIIFISMSVTLFGCNETELHQQFELNDRVWREKTQSFYQGNCSEFDEASSNAYPNRGDLVGMYNNFLFERNILEQLSNLLNGPMSKIQAEKISIGGEIFDNGEFVVLVATHEEVFSFVSENQQCSGLVFMEKIDVVDYDVDPCRFDRVSPNRLIVRVEFGTNREPFISSMHFY